MTDSLNHPVPHLTTANTAPLNHLESLMLDRQLDIEAWFRPEWQKTPAPITCSVDIRNAGYKIAPVDTNLFPAGFNNLNPEFHALCIQAAQNIINQSMPGCKKILLIPENHTRNQHYFSSIKVLFDILRHAGFDIRLGSLSLTATEIISTDNGGTLTLYPIQRTGNRLHIDDFSPCLILLNNDLSEGVPELLHGLEQWVRPSEQLGWANRLKSDHFKAYHEVVTAFCSALDIAPWRLEAQFTTEELDFSQPQSEQNLKKAVAQLLSDIQKKYQQYQLAEQPYAVVKADAGTYGMGILMVKDSDEVINLNRKQRKKMQHTKGKKPIDQVIIQEGVPTYESWQTDDAVAEPVVYMIGHHVVGGFYRVHTGRGIDENLNAPGMHFEPLAFTKPCNYPKKNDCQNRFYVYGVIARLAALAAARELAELHSERERTNYYETTRNH